jgi:PAS domain S-box-containing protein
VGAERIKGYRAHEIIGKHFSIFYPPEDIADHKTERELEIAVREGRFEEEGWRVRKDGSRIWANVTITALRNPEGVLIGFAKVTRDLTERLQAEEARRAIAEEKAALAEKARIQEFQERFLAVLGHDLRNPLASIDMGTGILRQRATDPIDIRVMDRMRVSSLRMSRMIEQILDLTRTRLGGGLDIHPQPLDLRDAIDHVVDELRAANPSRTIQVDAPPLPGTWDRDRLEQVFSNLVGNALVHGDPAKPVSIRARMEGQSILVEVHNEGHPIPKELHSVIFNPFRRGQRDSRTQGTAGLGLGLYISNEAVIAHGGRIDLQSSVTEGTTFQVRLPR